MPKFYKLLRCVFPGILLMAVSIVAYSQPKADFSISAASGCSPLSESFTNLTTGGTTPYTCFWRLGNSNTSTLNNAGAIYINPGVYYITLIVIDFKGGKDSVTKSVTVFANPKALFKADVLSGCPPLSVNFSDLSKAGSGSITGWLWDFGDGNISKSQNPPTHKYVNGGKYSVSLQVTDKNGCTHSVVISDYINAYIPPVIDFSLTVTSPCNLPATASFKSKITAVSTVTYLWDFGDGTNSSDPNPVKSYSNPGNYTVTLKCTDASGCVSITTKSNFVSVGAPVAVFTPSPVRGCSPLNVSFDNQTSGSGNSYTWNFGDGGTSTVVNPSHIYASGSYTVTLIAKSSAGCIDSMSNNIVSYAAFKASFTADSLLCTRHYFTTFINTSKGRIASSFWKFGDGKAGAGLSVFHTYPDSPDQHFHTVTLITTDSNGCSATLTKPNYINSQQTFATMHLDKHEGCAPVTINFENHSTSNDTIVSVKWNFGDGTGSTNYYKVTHTYKDTGVFYATLSVTTRKGCTGYTVRKIKSGVMPHADFSGSPRSGCLNKLRSLKYINLSNNGPGVKSDSFIWHFGYDPYFINGKIEAPPGDYYAELIAYNNGCPDTMDKINYIHIDSPWARYTTKRDSCFRNEVSFYDKSIGASRVIYYFGDSDSSTLRNPVHIYTKPGLYFPIQVVFDATNGCSDTFSFYSLPEHYGLLIKPPWKRTITPISATSGCLPLSVVFRVYSNDTSSHIVYYGDGDSEEVFTTTPYFTSFTIVHTYTKKGIFQVKMVSKDVGGCMYTQLLNPKIETYGSVALFSVNKTRGCAPLTVELIDSSTSDSTIISKEYDMGNGDHFKVTSPVMYYTYKSPPANQAKGYVITLMLTDKYCINFRSIKLFVTEPFTKIYTFNNATCNSVEYQFLHSDVGLGPFKYFWDFGDGDTTSAGFPFHTFIPGNYKVRLQMKDTFGCVDTTSQFLNIATNQSTANFSINITQSTCPPFTAQFRDLSKFSTTGTRSWHWDFGDGSSSTEQNPVKVYYTAGSFDVTLSITDDIGCKSSITKNSLIKIKGPIGNYNFYDRHGCTPLTVHFRAISSNASKYSWDLGDGTIAKGDTLTHVYKDAKHYLPLLILSDSSGCTYTLPPIDTIFVYAPPKSDFNYDTICSGSLVHFQDKSDPGTGRLITWNWDFGDGGAGSGPDPVHTYIKNGYYPVNLSTSNSFGCKDTAQKPVRSGSVIAKFKIPVTGCIGSSAQFNDLTISKSLISSWQWNFGDGTTSTLQNPTHRYLAKGSYSISLFVKNTDNCSDSLNKSSSIIIGDTVAPPQPILYRATVVDDHTVEIDFGKYHDVDFARYVIYMRNSAGNFTTIDSITDRNDTNYLVHNLNTLHNVYCFEVQSVNVCGFRSPLSVINCTIDLTAKPSVNQALLSWTPYSGWDVRKYNIYRQMPASSNYKFIDTVPGDKLNYVDTTVVCYMPMIYRVEAFEKGGNHQVSWSDTSATIPIHIPKVPATEVIRATIVENKNALVEWKDRPSSHIKNFILEKSIDGINFQALDTGIQANIFNITDPKVNVQNTSYTYRVKIIDSCGDVGLYSNIGKTILLKVDTSMDVLPSLSWNSYQNWPDGVMYYDIEIKDANGNFTWLARTNNGNITEFIDNITDINSLPAYTYHVIAQRSNQTYGTGNTSMSNDATLRPHSRLFVPNAITPNGDTHNDSFFVKGMYIKDFHMRIFDRWGTKVFESNTMKAKWGGDFKKGIPIQDAYKYLIYYKGIDGNDGYLSGWVTVLE